MPGLEMAGLIVNLHKIATRDRRIATCSRLSFVAPRLKISVFQLFNLQLLNPFLPCLLLPTFSPRVSSLQLSHLMVSGPMKLISLNLGLPREVPWHKTTVTTGIFKQPVSGRVALRKLNLDGDRQADLRVHGGEYKAVYCYPVEHYAYWK